MNLIYYTVPPLLLMLVFYLTFIRKRHGFDIKPVSLPYYECEFLIRYYEHLSDDAFVYRLPIPIGVNRSKVKKLLYKVNITRSDSSLYEVKNALVTITDSIMVFLPADSMPKGIPFNAKCRVRITFIWEE